MRIACMFLAATAVVGGAGTAQAQIANTWSDKRAVVEFRDEGKGKWAEYHRGKQVFDFKETSRGKTVASLFDSSRGLRVDLYDNRAAVLRDGKVERTYKGGWDWTVWKVSRKEIEFRDEGGDKWAEYHRGKKMFDFTLEARHIGNRVDLYDASRGIRVRLLSDKAEVSVDGKVTLTHKGIFIR